MNIWLYGSGRRCEILVGLIKDTDIVIERIIDESLIKWGTRLNQYSIEAPECLFECKDAYVCVTFFGENDYEPIWGELGEKYGISRDRILSFHDVIKLIFSNEKISGINVCNGSPYKALFDGAWEFTLGGVESWLKDTVLELVKVKENVFLMSKHSQFDWEEDAQRHILHFFLNTSCEFTYNNVKKAMDFLSSQFPCNIICSRADEILLAAYLIRKKAPEVIRIFTVIHGVSDGIIRDLACYNDEIERYLCVSSASKEALVNLGINEEKCELITPPIRFSNIERHEYSPVNKPIRLGYAGRIEVIHKRSDLLIELIKDLENLNVNYEFEIIGEGSYLPVVKNFIESNRLESKVLYKGVADRSEICDFWLDKDISINISDTEGRPISNIEAMYCGAVPVVTATKGIKDDVIDKVTGYVIEKGNHYKMAEQISYLEHNRETLKITGEKARESISQKIDVDEYVKRWLKLLDA